MSMIMPIKSGTAFHTDPHRYYHIPCYHWL